MLMAEEKLAVKVAEVYSIKIDDMYFAEAGEEKVFEELTADAASANEKDSRLKYSQRQDISQVLKQEHILKGVLVLSCWSSGAGTSLMRFA